MKRSRCTWKAFERTASPSPRLAPHMEYVEEDVEFLDSYAHTKGYPSRSAVLHKAVQLPRAADLGDAYEDAWDDWTTTGEAELWDVAAGDGVTAT